MANFVRKIVLCTVAICMILMMFVACGTTPATEEVVETPEPTPAPPVATVVELGQTYTIEGVGEFTITGYELTDQVKKNGMVMLLGGGFKPTDSTTLLVAKVNFTNLTTEAVDGFHLIEEAQLVYQGTYIFEGRSGGWSDIPALGSGEVYFIFHVAKTAVESGEPLIATMMIGDELIEHTIVLAGE